MSGTASATTYTWNGTTGNWDVNSAWSPFGTPGSSDFANIGGTGIVTVNTAQAAGAISNAGAIDIDALTLTISGNANGGTSINSGTITAGSLSTGSLLLENTVLTNTGGNIVVNGSGSFLNQIDSTITGGTLTTTNGGLIQSTNAGGNFLTGVTLNGTLDLASATSIERISGGMTLNGAINVNNNSILAFQGDQTIGGTGTITLGSTGGSNRIRGLRRSGTKNIHKLFAYS